MLWFEGEIALGPSVPPFLVLVNKGIRTRAGYAGGEGSASRPDRPTSPLPFQETTTPREGKQVRMDDARRQAVLDEIEAWRAEGILEDEEYAYLRGRYELEASLRVASDAPGYATHLLGGTLLGAALIALVHFFVPLGGWQPLAALVLAATTVGAALVGERRRGSLAAEAALAAGLVAAASVPFYAVSPPLLGLLAAIVAVGVTLLRRGTTPLTLLASAAFFLGMQHATRVEPLAAVQGGPWVFLVALLAYGALLARQRAARWANVALASHAVALAIAAFPALDALRVTDPGLAALGVGTLLALLFLAGLRLDARPLVAVSAALLAIAAGAFAFLSLGPALAAIVLLLVGAVLVWHAEAVKGYFAVRNGEGPASGSHAA